MLKKKLMKDKHVPGFEFIQKSGDIKEYRLTKNGLTILLVPIKGSETITTAIVYHVGSRHEGRFETGLSHMLEHMLFMGVRSEGPTWKDMENVGAYLNANTSFDRTAYYFNFPQAYLETALHIESNRMRDIIITDKVFFPERKNVLSEFDMYANEPLHVLQTHILATAFEEHPYHHNTIGYRSDIENYTTTQLKSYYDAHYQPGNATLIISGAPNDRETLSLVKKYFGKLKKGETLSPRTTKEPKQQGIRRVSLERQTPLKCISFSYKAPAFREREWTALFLLLQFLSHGTESPLHKELVDTGLATSVETDIHQTHDPYLFSIDVFATEKTSYDTIENKVRNVLQSVITTPLTDDELSLIKESEYASQLFSRDGSLRVTHILIECVASGSWTRYGTILEELKSLTSEDIQNVARKYITDSSLTIGTIDPKPSTL